MKKIFLAFIFAVTPIGIDAEENKNLNGCLEANIFFILDWSGSVDDVKTWSLRLIEHFLDNLELSEGGIKASIVLFGNSYYILSDLSSNNEDLRPIVEELKILNTTGSSDISAVFEPINAFINMDKSIREKEVLNIVIVISDGDVDNPVKSLEQMEGLKKSHNVSSMSLILESQYTKIDYLVNIASKDLYFGKDYRSLVFEIKKLDTCF